MEALGNSLLGIGVVFAVLVFLMVIVYIMSTIYKASAKRAEQNAPEKQAKAKAKAEEKAAKERARLEKNAAKLEKSGEFNAETVDAYVAQPPKGPTAPGALGDVKLFDVPNDTAALIMAIVADQMECDINELRFISIKEVK